MASKIKKTSKIRNAFYTLNNYTSDHVSQLKRLPCTYHVMGFETGDSGTPHIQGLIIFKNPRAFKSVHKLLFNAHIAPMRGTHKQASDYCKKDGEYHEAGDLPNPGKRTDIDTLVGMLRDDYKGNSTQMFCDKPADSFRFYKFLDRIAVNLQQPRTTKTEVIWCHGPTGCGKSRWAYETYPNAYSKNLDESFWENYQGEETVIFDDLRPSHFSLTTLLRLFDRYPLQVKVKCSSAQFRRLRIIVTSSVPPTCFYPDSNGQLERRIETIKDSFSFIAPQGFEGGLGHSPIQG